MGIRRECWESRIGCLSIRLLVPYAALESCKFVAAFGIIDLFRPRETIQIRQIECFIARFVIAQIE